jgi:hypothetical protein
MARKVIKKNTRSEEYVINKKYLGGDEPAFSGPLTSLDYTNALNWYNYMNNTSDAREYLNDYLKSQGRMEDVKKLKSVSDIWIPTTIAWIARLLSKGYELPMDARTFIEERLKQTLSKSNSTQETKSDNSLKISIQDRIRERTRDILGEIEGLIDDHMEEADFSFYSWLQSNEIPPSYVSSVIIKFTPVLLELIEAYEGKDDQLKEAYKYLSKPQLKDRIKFFNGLIEDANRYSNNTKKTKTVRKPRTISSEKKLKSFKYQKEDNTFKIASVNPEKIIGAQELWTFNTKYKTLTVFRALDRGGLDVKGTSIIKYDEESSITMRTGRKPEDAIKKALEGGKIVLRKLDQEFKNHAALQARINENTIILRVLS